MQITIIFIILLLDANFFFLILSLMTINNNYFIIFLLMANHDYFSNPYIGSKSLLFLFFNIEIKKLLFLLCYY